MAGVASRICSCWRAICSTRKGVACARRSTCKRSCSSSSRLASLRALSRAMNIRRDS
eukprot:gene38355-47351_t